MPLDPQTLRLLQLQGLIPGDGQQPIDQANPTAPVNVGLVPTTPFGLDPATLARIQNGLPTAPAPQPAPPVSSEPTPDWLVRGTTPAQASAPSDASVDPDLVADRLAAGLTPKGLPMHSASVGPATGQPIPEGGLTERGEPMPNLPVRVPPAFDDSLKGSPSAQGQTPPTLNNPTGTPPAPPQPPVVPTQPPVPEETWSQKFQRTLDSETVAAFKDIPVNPDGTPSQTSASALALQTAGYTAKLHAAALSASLGAEEARRQAPYAEAHQLESSRIADETQARIRQFQADVADKFQRANVAIQQANANVPNPDNLFGGKGSWQRAITIGLTAGSAGVTPQGITSLLSQAMLGPEARYKSRLDYARNLMDLGKSEAESLPGMASGFDAMQKAAMYRLAGAYESIAKQMQPGQLQTTLINTAGDIRIQQAKDTMKMAVDSSSIEKNEAEAYAKGFYKGAPLGGLGGGGGTGGRSTAAADARYNALSRKDQERTVWNADHTDFVLAKDKETATAQQGLVDSANITTNVLDDTIAKMQTQIPSFKDKVLGKAGWSTEDLAVIRSELSLAIPRIANAAVGGGKRTPLAELKAVKEALDNPGAFSSQTLKQLYTYRDSLVDEASASFKSTHPGFVNPTSFGHAPDIAKAPDSVTLAQQVVGDYVPGTKHLDVNAAADALDGYVSHFYDTDERGQRIRKDAKTGTPAKDAELLDDLNEMLARVKLNRGKALLNKEMQKVADYVEVERAIKAKILDVQKGVAKRAHDEAQKVKGDQAVKDTEDAYQGDMP